LTCTHGLIERGDRYPEIRHRNSGLGMLPKRLCPEILGMSRLC
jgi:hypothetical protein